MQLSDEAGKMAAAYERCTEPAVGGARVILYVVLAVAVAVGFLVGLFVGLVV